MIPVQYTSGKKYVSQILTFRILPKFAPLFLWRTAWVAELKGDQIQITTKEKKTYCAHLAIKTLLVGNEHETNNV